MASKPLPEWTVEEAQLWLLQQGNLVATEEAIESFASNEIDGQALLLLDSDDIRDELQIKNYRSRKALMASLEQLRYIDCTRQLGVAARIQRSSIQDDVEEMENATTLTDDYREAVRLWDAEISTVQQITQDADYGAKVHSISLGAQRCCEVGAVTAHELSRCIVEADRQSQIDGAVARRVRDARSEQEVVRLLQPVGGGASRASTAGQDSELEDSDAESVQSLLSQLSAPSMQGPALRELGDAPGASSSSSSWQGTPALLPPPPRSSRVRAKRNIQKRECLACLKSRWHTKELKCKHVMCYPCLGKLFQTAASDLTLWPIRCCSQPIDISIARVALKPAEYLMFTSLAEEAQCKNKMYCTDPYCSQFINLEGMPPGVTKYACPRCGQELCVECRSSWHDGYTCQEWSERAEEADRDMLDLAERNGWRRCPGCRMMVQMSYGCNHMKCRCGVHFCYMCGSGWQNAQGAAEQQCQCNLWVEERLVEEEHRRVNIIEHVEQRRVPADERAQIRRGLEAGECEHGEWERDDRGWNSNGLEMDCSGCGFFMKHYGHRCVLCGDYFCQICRFNRS